MSTKRTTTAAVLGLLSACSIAASQAGTPMDSAATTSERNSIFSGSLSAGYDTDYIFQAVSTSARTQSGPASTSTSI